MALNIINSFPLKVIKSFNFLAFNFLHYSQGIRLLGLSAFGTAFRADTFVFSGHVFIKGIIRTGRFKN